MGKDVTYQPNVYRRQNDQAIVLRGNTGLIVSEDALWGNCPLINGEIAPRNGSIILNDDFTTYNAQATTGDWIATQATAGTAVISTTVPGAILLDAGASTAHQGIQIQRAKSMFLPAANKSIWFEATGILAGTALTIETFIGLADLDTGLITTGALHPINCIGWSSVTGDGVLLFGATKASTSSTPIAAVTLSLTVPHNLGFFYDGVADTVQQFIDGVATGAPIATADIPKVAIYPSFVCQSTGTSEPTLTVGGYQVFQLR